MKVRSLYRLAATLALAVPATTSASERADPPKPVEAAKPAADAMALENANQGLADQVARRMRAQKLGDSCDVSIVCYGGTVTLTGTARDAKTKERVLHEARSVGGVTLVRDGVKVAPSAAVASGVVAAQGNDAPATLPPAPVPVQPTPVPTPVPVQPTPVPAQPTPVRPMMPMPVPQDGPLVEPAPLGAPGTVTPDQQAPPLPPHAWPTYAPYNNVSRVAYPQAYPYNAFPFIGPYYPFPKVPLGWRKVVLEWEDGHWYYGRVSSPHDYWRVKFW